MSRSRRRPAPTDTHPDTVTASPAAAPTWWVPAVFVVVAALTVAAFWPSLDGDFVSWDDDKNFLLNPHFRGLGWDNIRWMWTTFHLGTWIPLSWMTLGLSYELHGMNPVGYHAANMALHALNAGLLYLLGLRLLVLPGDSTRARLARTSPALLHLAAAFGALVFSLHPLRVESVTWITERRDVQAGFFYLATVLAFLRFARETHHPRRWYALALTLHVLALLSKGTAVTVPGVLALLWVYPLQQLGGHAGWGRDVWWRAVRVIAPFLLLAVAVTIVVFVALQPEEQLPLLGKLAVSTYSWCFYLGRTLWPTDLAPLYAMPEVVNPWATRYLVCYAIVLAVTAACWRLRTRLPGGVMALVMFSAIAFPLLGVHQGGPQIASDRNTHNASFALVFLAGGAMLLLLARARVLALIGGGMLLTVLAGLTWQQTQIWHDSERLWTRVLEVEPESPYAHNNYGNLMFQQGRVNDALSHYALAVRYRPHYAQALANYGVALAASGRTDEAIDAYRRAIAMLPNLDDAEGNWGVALMRQGDVAGAVGHFARAIELNPANADAHVNWGNALVRLGRASDALAHYARAIELQPDHADAELNWGVALAVGGNLPDATRHFRRALDINPSLQMAREYLAQAEATMRRGSPPPP